MDIKIDIEYRNEKLKPLRETAGITRAQLAEKTGISTRVLESYEQGLRNLNGARLSTLTRLCGALGCRLQDLITEPQTLAVLDDLYPQK